MRRPRGADHHDPGHRARAVPARLRGLPAGRRSRARHTVLPAEPRLPPGALVRTCARSSCRSTPATAWTPAHRREPVAEDQARQHRLAAEPERRSVPRAAVEQLLALIESARPEAALFVDETYREATYGDAVRPRASPGSPAHRHRGIGVQGARCARPAHGLAHGGGCRAPGAHGRRQDEHGDLGLRARRGARRRLAAPRGACSRRGAGCSRTRWGNWRVVRRRA